MLVMMNSIVMMFKTTIELIKMLAWMLVNLSRMVAMMLALRSTTESNKRSKESWISYTQRKVCVVFLKHELELPCFLAMHVFQFTLLASGLFLNAMLAVSLRKLRNKIEAEVGFETFEEKDVHQRRGK